MSSSRLVGNFLAQLRADGLIRPNERVLIALSGGSDSVALLHLLSSVAPPLQLTLYAAHLDHAIRPQSGADLDFVRALCGELGVPLSCERVDVPALAVKKKVGLEEAGRMARHAYLLAEAARLDCSVIALGHHRGDQAETLLHHLGRGCGVRGLAGMRRRRGLFVRPLLAYSKAELVEFLAQIGGEFVVDPSNDELDFTRNRIRHQLLPAYASLNPQIEATLSSLADVAAQEEDFWLGETARLVDLLVKREDGELQVSVIHLLELHPAQRFRLLQEVLTPFAQGVRKEVGVRHVVSVDRLLTSPTPQGEIHLPGLKAIRRYDRLIFRSDPLPVAEPWSLEISAPGVYHLPSGGVLRIEAVTSLGGGGRDVVEFAASHLSFPFTLRTLRPGDRMQLSGMSGRKRLKEWAAEQKIPLEERRRLCVLVKEEILWIVGLRRSGLYLPERGQAVWRLVYSPAEFP